MTWQDQLRQLDEELTAGRISAEEYRRRRDEVQAQAQGGDQGAAAAQQAQPPHQPAQQATPFPPPFRWENTTTGSEATQVMQPVSKPGQPPAESTQVMNGPAAPEQVDPERTQVVRASEIGQQSPFLGQQGHVDPSGVTGTPQPAQSAGWQDDVAPPWVGSELPPLDTGASWVKQGPEVFEETRGGNTGKIVGAAAAVVLLLAIAFGAYWLWGRGPATGGNNQPQPTVAASATATTAPKPKDPLAVADMGGTKEDHSDIKTFADIQSKIPYLTVDEQQVYQQAAATKVQFVVVHLSDGASVVVLTVQASGKQAAASAAQTLGDLQQRYGMQPVTGEPAGVVVTEIPEGGQAAKVRAHYAAANGVIVRVEVTSGSNGKPDAQTVLKDLNSALAKQLKITPAAP